MFEFWIGEQKRPLKKDSITDDIMDTAFNYYYDSEPVLPYQANKLFLDSGAYSAMRRKITCLLYTSPSPRDLSTSRMPSSA